MKPNRTIFSLIFFSLFLISAFPSAQGYENRDDYRSKKLSESVVTRPNAIPKIEAIGFKPVCSFHPSCAEGFEASTEDDPNNRFLRLNPGEYFCDVSSSLQRRMTCNEGAGFSRSSIVYPASDGFQSDYPLFFLYFYICQCTENCDLDPPPTCGPGFTPYSHEHPGYGDVRERRPEDTHQYACLPEARITERDHICTQCGSTVKNDSGPHFDGQRHIHCGPPEVEGVVKSVPDQIVR